MYSRTDFCQTVQAILIGIICFIFVPWLPPCSGEYAHSRSGGRNDVRKFFHERLQPKNFWLHAKGISLLSPKHATGSSTYLHKLSDSNSPRRPRKIQKKSKRRKRSVVNDISDAESGGFHIDVTKCGVEKSCIRFGDTGCGHTDCLYILTYKTVEDRAIVEIELSAKIDGWVGVGFSSDKKMGGDDVIACIHTISPSMVRAAALENTYSYEKPKEKNVPLNLTGASYKDGVTSCRLRRSVAIQGALDLTNDWYQLYAWGPVASNEDMMRHDWEQPPTSPEKYSTLYKDRDVIRPANGAVTMLQLNGLLLSAATLFNRLL